SFGLQGLAAKNLPISWAVIARRIASLTSCPKAVAVCIHILAGAIRLLNTSSPHPPIHCTTPPWIHRNTSACFTDVRGDEDELRWCLDFVSML
ncbi:unnamed protein product, partial [Ectocarpus sp. 6 AP-2014]